MLAATDDFGLSYLLEWIAVLLVIAFIWRKVAPYVKKLMENKRAEISARLSEGEEARRLAEALVAERRAALEEAKAEAVTIVEQARAAAAALVDDGERRAEEERRRIVARAGAEVEGVRNRVRSEVVAEIGALVVAAAEQVVAIELDSTNQHRLIGEAIAATESEVAH